jgi:hypothetical protein
MQQFTRCPFCNDVMLNREMTTEHTLKSCKKHPNHRIDAVSDDTTNEIYAISILINNNPTIWATWHFLDQEIRIHNYSKTISKILGDALPWFEPDLSDYCKLINKIRTYILFS